MSMQRRTAVRAFLRRLTSNLVCFPGPNVTSYLLGTVSLCFLFIAVTHLEADDSIRSSNPGQSRTLSGAIKLAQSESLYSTNKPGGYSYSQKKKGKKSRRKHKSTYKNKPVFGDSSYDYYGSHKSKAGKKKYAVPGSQNGYLKDKRKKSAYQQFFFPFGIQQKPKSQYDQEQEREFETVREPTYRTMCVRLCDGYYFPISAATPRSRFRKDNKQCTKRCDMPVKLYAYQNPGGTLEEMVDLKGKPYSKLENAFRYREELVPDCKCKPEPWSTEAKAKHVQYAKWAEEWKQKQKARKGKKRKRKHYTKRKRKRYGKSRSRRQIRHRNTSAKIK